MVSSRGFMWFINRQIHITWDFCWVWGTLRVSNQPFLPYPTTSAHVAPTCELTQVLQFPALFV